jgi:hypothetical protein
VESEKKIEVGVERQPRVSGRWWGHSSIQAFPSREDQEIRYDTILQTFLFPQVFCFFPLPPKSLDGTGAPQDGKLEEEALSVSFIARLQSLNQAWGRRIDGLPKWQIVRFVGGCMCFILACDLGSMGCCTMTALLRKKKEDDKEEERDASHAVTPGIIPISGWTPKVACQPFYISQL